MSGVAGAPTPIAARLTPRFRVPARDALVSFLFSDPGVSDPVLDRGDDWCAWDGGPPAPAEILEGPSGSDVGARSRVTIALAPGATHLAVARGRRLAIAATVPHAASDADASPHRLCVAEIPDAAGPGERVTALCWIAFAVPGPGPGPGSGSGSTLKPGAPPPVHDLCVVVGTSAGRVRVHALDGSLLISQRVDVVGGADGGPSPVRALHARDARRSPSRDDPAEDLTVVLDAAVVRVDALELRSSVRRASLAGPAAAAAAAAAERDDRDGAYADRAYADRASADRASAVVAALDATRPTPLALDDTLRWNPPPPLTVTRWDLSRVAPVADAACVGRLPPSFARVGLASAEDDARGRGVGMLAAGLGDPRGDAGVVALLASYEDRETVLDAATAMARGAATTAAAAVSSIFGGAIGLAGAVTKNLPVGRALGGAVVGAVSTAGNAVGSAAAGALGVGGSGGGGGAGGGASGGGLDAHDAPGRTLTWRSALVDPPRRVRRFIPAPRGPLCAAADSLGRVAVLDVAAPGALTSAKTLKGCRDAEVAWVEAPPPRGTNARVLGATGGLGAMYLAVRSPHRNAGAVELWEFAGGGSGSGGSGGGGGGVHSGVGGEGTRMLQAATPFGCAAAAGTPAAAVAQAVAASRCYLLTADGLLREVSA